MMPNYRKTTGFWYFGLSSNLFKGKNYLGTFQPEKEEYLRTGSYIFTSSCKKEGFCKGFLIKNECIRVSDYAI